MAIASHMPPSLWADTAPAGRNYPTLQGAQRSDVVIIGGGFTGLSAALALAKRGISVTLLEAESIGWGASGRNGGQVIPGLKYDPDELITRYGEERGQRMIALSARNADVVFELIKQHNIDCDAQQRGWIQPAVTHASLKSIESRARQWQSRGVDIVWLDQQQCAERLGTSEYLGGWVDPRAGGLNPLAYARGLAQAAHDSGATLHEHTRVTSLTRVEGRWRVMAEGGAEIQAERVLLCTNGYSDALQPKLASSLIAANSYQIATRPLTAEEGSHILPGGEVASDARKLLLYFRRDQAGRLLMGGRGSFNDPRKPSDFRHLENAISKLYPQLKDVEIAFRWAGRIAITQDSLPHLHEPQPGLTVALGYNGRGVAMGTHLGKLIGEHLGEPTLKEVLPFPFTPIKPIPMHGLQRLYVETVVNYYRARDWLER
ncbi:MULTISPECIES: NAD(P)/FAD-dependent oxidoreductase [unclassified Halomonas]|uniref:NAD(P)/FAD-dependent oxidoreductase n=1 Tax=unclassified Halomonas TaxID=2609666 RepID=UPI001CF45A00|nr:MULTISPECIES: FAD-dependent oxidoreductase [unclassified Halomonas]MCA8863480.1 FAD-binding oxidoreductase [Halomonas sp. SBBP1]UZH08799.1 FAD-binding oxidoreductase [Halomonas sp. BDJS001]